MGSGLILLLIVGAWLAVLVPMGLRSHDQATSMRPSERFRDAMHVLARRPTGNERTSLVPRRPAGSRTVLSAGRTPPQERLVATPSFLERFDDGDLDDGVRPPLTLVARRRRTLLVLLASSVLSSLVGLLGPGVLLAPAALLLLATGAFVAHCRRQVVLEAERRRLRGVRGRVEDRRTGTARSATPRPAGIPARPAPLVAPLPAPAARYDEQGAAPGTWEPVPVPLPTYVGKAVAPARPRRVLDLTRPGEWTAALDSEDSFLAQLEDGKDLEVILERRRAVGGW